MQSSIAKYLRTYFGCAWKLGNLHKTIGVVACIPLAATAGAAANDLPPAAASAEAVEERSTAELEARQQHIDARLKELADFHTATGMGPIGFRSLPSQSPSPDEWVQVDFAETRRIDQIVLVPTLWRNTRDGTEADAFPVAFKVITLDDGGRRTVVAAYTEADRLVPRIAPLVIDFPPRRAKAVRIEVTQMAARAWDQLKSLQLAEMIVFSGNENVALHQEVTASSSEEIGARGRRYLVDGFLPYLMGARTGGQSTAFLIEYDPDAADPPELRIDLGQSYPVNQVNLHALETSDTIPQSVPSDYAFPRKFVVEGANDPDFREATRLFSYEVDSVFDVGSILTERFPATHCRYIRLRVLEPYTNPNQPESPGYLALAEIEVIANGSNVAEGQPVSSSIDPSNLGRTVEALTDGRNFYGAILPLREWLGQLELRHALERERPQVEQILKERYARQRTILNQLIWVIVVIILLAVFLTVLTRLMAQRSIQRTRERIAADLHDELGANLHAIGLLSDLSQIAQNNPEKLSSLLARMRRLTEHTGAAARHCTNMLEAEELYGDIAEHFRRASGRILHGIHHQLSIEGSEHLARLSPRKRIDLCLFYQECLTNILRHSAATEATTELRATPKAVDLCITDNGKGLDPARSPSIPKSIRRRSRLLGAKVSVQPRPEGGTRVTLSLKINRFLFT